MSCQGEDRLSVCVAITKKKNHGNESLKSADVQLQFEFQAQKLLPIESHNFSSQCDTRDLQQSTASSIESWKATLKKEQPKERQGKLKGNCWLKKERKFRVEFVSSDRFYIFAYFAVSYILRAVSSFKLDESFFLSFPNFVITLKSCNTFLPLITLCRQLLNFKLNL